MGGSSLCPEVLRLTFGKIKGFPELHVLDSTDPAQIKAIEKKVDLKSTICIVSSKSGSTLEPNIYKQYFFEQVKKKVGEKEVGNRFIAITDPGSKMQTGRGERQVPQDLLRRAQHRRPLFRACRISAWCPASIMGIDIPKFLKITRGNGESLRRRRGRRHESRRDAGRHSWNCGAVNGRDKITIIASPGIHDLGAWLEQLIAESTGKIGKGIIPVDRETLGKPAVYGNDRVFAYLRLKTKPNKAQDAAVAALEKAGHPVVRISLPEHLQSRPGIFPLGDRHRGRRLDHRHQCLQSAGRGSQQDRNQES